jgi:hypothetical protein
LLVVTTTQPSAVRASSSAFRAAALHTSAICVCVAQRGAREATVQQRWRG